MRTQEQIVEKRERQTRFLKLYDEQFPDFAGAAKEAEVPLTTYYEWANNDEAFINELDAVNKIHTGRLKRKVYETALNEKWGVGYILPLLRAYEPETFGEKLDVNHKVTQVTLVSGLRDPKQIQDADFSVIDEGAMPREITV